MTQDLTLVEIGTQEIIDINSNFTVLKNAHSGKAKLNGDSAELFNVADAIEPTNAINKRQLDSAVSAINVDIMTLENEVVTKADKTYVDTNLATKINVSDTTITKQGNIFNGPSQLVQLNSIGQLPAIDGRLLTNIPSGTSNINALGSVSSSITLTADMITTAAFTGVVTVTLPTISDSSKETKIILDFTTTSASSPAISSTGALRWSDKNKGRTPSAYSTLSGVRNRLIFTTIDGGANWEAEYTCYGAVETAFIQPTLSSNGTLGGGNFAVSVDSYANGFEGYKAFDNVANTSWQVENVAGSHTLIIYNPQFLKISSLSFVTPSAYGYNYPIKTFTLYGSNDNSNYTLIGTYNIGYTACGNLTYNVDISSSEYYCYHKILATEQWTPQQTTTTYYLGIAQININAVYMAT